MVPSNSLIAGTAADDASASANTIPLTQFLQQFKGGLLKRMTSTNPPVYTQRDPRRDAVMSRLKRQPFDAQRDAVQALAALLLDHGEKAAVLNAEMGTGKTAMSIFLAAVMHAEGFRRHLVICPPHLVYKWRREILDTVPGARVWVLNGPDSISKLIKLREILSTAPTHDDNEFFVLGRVRMRMGFHWRPAVVPRKRFGHAEVLGENGRVKRIPQATSYAACPQCGTIIVDEESNPVAFSEYKAGQQLRCHAVIDERTERTCNTALWTLMRPGAAPDQGTNVAKVLMQLPTIGPKTAGRLVDTFGASFLGEMLEDNIHEFINLLDHDGNLVFSDRQADRIGRALSKLEFSLNGGAPYQPTEYIKRYLPRDAFATLIADEAHEYKASASAQGHAFAVLASKVRKVVLLTGTLMGGYADDLFYLLFRCMPTRFAEDGFRYNKSTRSLGTAVMAFMEQYGVLKHVIRAPTEESRSFKTAKGRSTSRTISRAPGFAPAGLARYVLPFTVFLKLKEIGQNVLPPYTEEYVEIPMSEDMASAYGSMQRVLTSAMREALRKGDKCLTGVVLNALLAWPETCFREEVITHPRNRSNVIHYQASIYGDDEPTPKEVALRNMVLSELGQGRRVLVYTTYTDTRDTTARLKRYLLGSGIKAAVLKSTVATDKREDWILDQVDSGVQVIICNPELVKTGLDLLEFPTIVFLSTGYSTFTLQQASRRSWRIGQKVAVKVFFLGYANTTQTTCLRLMGKKIQVTQSTSGEMPETGLDALNEEGDSLEVALAKELLHG